MYISEFRIQFLHSAFIAFESRTEQNMPERCLTPALNDTPETSRPHFVCQMQCSQIQFVMFFFVCLFVEWRMESRQIVRRYLLDVIKKCYMFTNSLGLLTAPTKIYKVENDS